MPGLDSTGPMGQGSQTGRKLGNCSGENDAVAEETPRGRRLGRGFRNRNLTGPGAGMGRGRGRGRGVGRKANMR